MHTISDHLKKNSDTFDSIDYEDKGIIDLFSKYVFSCNDPSISIQEKIQQILSWAKKNEVEHYSFLSFPFNSGICEKQESLLDLQYYYSNLQLKNKSRLNISHDLFLKGEADGSSFPSGGLRKTH
jgi:glutamine synthetase type III